MRHATIRGSALDRNYRSDLGPWDLLEHGVSTTFALVPPSMYELPSQGDTIDEYNDLEDPQHKSLFAKSISSAPKRPSKPRVAKAMKMSRWGIPYPSLPTRLVKGLSSTFADSVGLKKMNISPESLQAIVEASDCFFEQLGEGLGTYAEHGGRRKIDERDVATVMKR